jgi:hypothetical protein
VKARGEKSDNDTRKSKSHLPQPTQWHLNMFSSTIPKSTMTLVNETFTIKQRTTVLLRFLVSHLVVVIVSMKRVVLQLKIKLKVSKAHESDTLSVKGIVGKLKCMTY